MKKQVLSAALASVTAIGLLAGCGSTGSTTSTSAAATTDSAPESKAASTVSTESGDGITIRMWTFLDPTNTENGRSVALKQMIWKISSA